MERIFVHWAGIGNWPNLVAKPALFLVANSACPWPEDGRAVRGLLFLKYPLDFLGSANDSFHIFAQLDNDSPITGYDVLGMG